MRLHADRTDSRAGVIGDYHVHRGAGDVEIHSGSRVGIRVAPAVGADARGAKPGSF